jgi:hypothetical protein
MTNAEKYNPNKDLNILFQKIIEYSMAIHANNQPLRFSNS